MQFAHVTATIHLVTQKPRSGFALGLALAWGAVKTIV
jgi:hypothetical protein